MSCEVGKKQPGEGFREKNGRARWSNWTSKGNSGDWLCSCFAFLTCALAGKRGHLSGSPPWWHDAVLTMASDAMHFEVVVGLHLDIVTRGDDTDARG